MVANTAYSLTIDLNQFKLHLHLDPKMEVTLLFDTPSRRFYLCILGLVVHVMKAEGRIIPVSLENHLDVLTLLNETIGGAAGSSDRKHLLPRIYRKWKDALPDLEHAPLFKVVGRRKKYTDSADRTYTFSETVKDNWANLFDYRGSHENVSLRFSIDRLGLGLDEVAIIFGSVAELKNGKSWERFIAHLRETREERLKPKAGRQTDEDARPGKGTTSLLTAKRLLKLRWALVSTSMVLLIIITIPLIRNTWYRPLEVEHASIERMAFPLPEKPSIAVLPFRNLSDDPEQDNFCDGLTQDIITGLSKISDLFVIAPHSSFAYKDSPLDLRQVSEELGVRHLLEGSVRRRGNRIRISVQLFDMIDATTLWAERYDRQLRDIFFIQDQITISILSALRYKLAKIERSRVLHKSTQNLHAYLKVLEGTGYMYLFRIDEGLKCFEDAIVLDPRFAEAYAWKSLAHMRSCWFGPRENRADHFVKAIENARRCKELDSEQAACNLALGLTHLMNFEFIDALREERLAVERWPGSAQAAALLALTLRAAGRHGEAIKEIDRALRLNPIRPIYALQVLGLVYFDTGRYDEAIAVCQKVLEITPLQLPAYMVLALAYTQEGLENEARSAAEEILRIRPDFTTRDYTMLFPKKTVKDIDAMLDGLFDYVK